MLSQEKQTPKTKEQKMPETTEKQDGSINLGDSLTLSALQLTLLCDSAIERFIDALNEYNENIDDEGDRVVLSLRNPPSTMEIARDEVVNFFKEHAKDVKPASV